MSLIKDINVKVFSNYSDDTTHLNTEDRMKAEGYKSVNEIIENYHRQDQGEFIIHLLRQFIEDNTTTKGHKYWLDVISDLADEIAENHYTATIRITSTIEVQSNEPFESEQDFRDNIYDVCVEDLVQGESYNFDVISNNSEIDEIYDVTPTD